MLIFYKLREIERENFNSLFHRPLLPPRAASLPAGSRQEGSGDGYLRHVRGG
jgi:hypothetical protein